MQRPTCGEQHLNTTGGWKLTQAGYCKVSGLRIIFEVFTNWIQNWFKKWDFTWSLGWRSCRGRARRGKASDEEPFSGCRGALSTCDWAVWDFRFPNTWIGIAQLWWLGIFRFKQNDESSCNDDPCYWCLSQCQCYKLYHYARSRNRQPWCDLCLSLWCLHKNFRSLLNINTQMSLSSIQLSFK